MLTWNITDHGQGHLQQPAQPRKKKELLRKWPSSLVERLCPSPGPNGQASASTCWPCPQGMCGRRAAMIAASKGGAGRTAGWEGAEEQLMHGPHAPRWKDGARSPPKWRNNVVLPASSIQHGNSSPYHLPTRRASHMNLERFISQTTESLMLII